MPSPRPKQRPKKDTSHRVSVDYEEYKRLQKNCKNKNKKRNGNQPVQKYSKSFYGLLVFTLIIGLLLGSVIGLFNPLKIQINKQFDFSIEAEDTYVSYLIDPINEYQNYSYQVVGIDIHLLYFDRESWNQVKDLNFTDLAQYMIDHSSFINLVWLFLNDENGMDNKVWNLQYFPICILSDITIYFSIIGSEDLSSVYISPTNIFFSEFPSASFDDYPYKADQFTDSIDIKIYGISFNFTENEYIDAFLSINNENLTFNNND